MSNSNVSVRTFVLASNNEHSSFCLTNSVKGLISPGDRVYTRQYPGGCTVSSVNGRQILCAGAFKGKGSGCPNDGGVLSLDPLDDTGTVVELSERASIEQEIRQQREFLKLDAGDVELIELINATQLRLVSCIKAEEDAKAAALMVKALAAKAAFMAKYAKVAVATA